MSAAPMPLPLKEVLRSLSFLGMLERGQKPNFHSNTMADAKSWLDAMYRTFAGENQTNGVINIERIVKTGIEALHEHDKTEFLPHILQGLVDAKRGINNLIYTYDKCPNTMVSLRVIIADIDLQLNKYKSLLPGYSATLTSDSKTD